MSRTINKLDQNDSRKRATIANVYASTPITKYPIQHSISLSGIDTASSSSGDRKNLQLQMQDLAKKHTRYTKRRKTEDTKRRTIDSDNEYEAKQKQLIDESLNKKRKRKKNIEKKTVRRRQILKDTDSEWETELERSINKPSTDSQGSSLDKNKFIKLFEDPCSTPEKTRDRPSTYEEILHTQGSPIIGAFTKTSHPISKKNKIILPDTLLPVNLQLTEQRNLEESDENETTFQNSSKQKSENFTFPKRYSPTTIVCKDNLHQNQFVKTYSRKRSWHSASSPSKPIKSMRKLPNVFRKRESSPIPPGMVCEIGSCTRNLQKWTILRTISSQNKLENNKRKTKSTKRNMRKFIRKQKCDAYDLIEIDNEFETSDGKRISFRDFCLKQKKNKGVNIRLNN